MVGGSVRLLRLGGDEAGPSPDQNQEGRQNGREQGPGVHDGERYRAAELQTGFGSKAGYEQAGSDKKPRPEEIADAIVGALKIDSRGFIPEFSVFATNAF